MKKKIIFLAVCAVLLLIFISTSYGGPDPKYVLLGHPWDHLLVIRITDEVPLLKVSIIIINVNNNTTPSILSDQGTVDNSTDLKTLKKSWLNNQKNIHK